MGKRKIDEVHFQIEGEFITEHMRSLVREGNWRKALDDLKHSLIGINSDQCFDILSGKYQLKGINTVDFVPDDKHLDKEWCKKQYYTYFRNFFYHDGKFYNPYGCVRYLNKHDLELAMLKLEIKELPISSGFSGATESVTDLNYARAETYRKSSNDFVFYSNTYHNFVISRKIDNPDYPIWLTKEQAAELSMQQLSSNHSLDDGELDDVDVLRELAANKRINDKLESAGIAAPGALDEYIVNLKKSKDFSENIDTIKQEISNQADKIGGWLTLENSQSGAKYTIPKNAFYRWCLSTNSGYRAIEWHPVSPRGVKMGGDDPNHTDWWLFTGLNMDDAHNTDNLEVKFFFDMRHKYTNLLTGADLALLTNKKGHKGFESAFVRHVNTPLEIDLINDNDVVIIPQASPEFEAVAHRCAKKNCVLITQTGGKLCHLATIGREFGLALYLLPDAASKYPMGSNVCIDLVNGTIKTLDLPIKDLMRLKLTGLFYK